MIMSSSKLAAETTGGGGEIPPFMCAWPVFDDDEDEESPHNQPDWEDEGVRDNNNDDDPLHFFPLCSSPTSWMKRQSVKSTSSLVRETSRFSPISHSNHNTHKNHRNVMHRRSLSSTSQLRYQQRQKRDDDHVLRPPPTSPQHENMSFLQALNEQQKQLRQKDDSSSISSQLTPQSYGKEAVEATADQQDHTTHIVIWPLSLQDHFRRVADTDELLPCDVQEEDIVVASEAAREEEGNVEPRDGSYHEASRVNQAANVSGYWAKEDPPSLATPSKPPLAGSPPTAPHGNARRHFSSLSFTSTTVTTDLNTTMEDSSPFDLQVWDLSELDEVPPPTSLRRSTTPRSLSSPITLSSLRSFYNMSPVESPPAMTRAAEHIVDDKTDASSLVMLPEFPAADQGDFGAVSPVSMLRPMADEMQAWGIDKTCMSEVSAANSVQVMPPTPPRIMASNSTLVEDSEEPRSLDPHHWPRQSSAVVSSYQQQAYDLQDENMRLRALVQQLEDRLCEALL